MVPFRSQVLCFRNSLLKIFHSPTNFLNKNGKFRFFVLNKIGKTISYARQNLVLDVGGILKCWNRPKLTSHCLLKKQLLCLSISMRISIVWLNWLNGPSFFIFASQLFSYFHFRKTTVCLYGTSFFVSDSYFYKIIPFS